MFARGPGLDLLLALFFFKKFQSKRIFVTKPCFICLVAVISMFSLHKAVVANVEDLLQHHRQTHKFPVFYFKVQKSARNFAHFDSLKVPR